MKVNLGPYTFKTSPYHGIRLFSVTGPWLRADIDWTDDKFPVGWCAGMSLGPKAWWNYSYGRWNGPYTRWSTHWSWNAPFGEPNRLDFRLGWVYVRFSCFTWWRTVEDWVEKDGITIMGRTHDLSHTHEERCRPHLEDGWPVIKVTRMKSEKRQ